MYQSIKINVGQCRQMMSDIIDYYGCQSRAIAHAGIGFTTYKRLLNKNIQKINHNSARRIHLCWANLEIK